MDSDPPSPPEDIAALMGFSSFGAAPKPKKRKYNPAVDNAVTDASLTVQERNQQQQQHKDYRPSSGASGGNRVPLGKGRVFGNGGTNEDRGPGVVGQPNGGPSDESTEAERFAASPAAGLEHGVGTEGRAENEGAGEDDAPRYVDTSCTPPAEERGVPALPTGVWGDDGPRYVDTSRPPPLQVPLPAAEQASHEVGGPGSLHGVPSTVQQQRQAPHARYVTSWEGRGGGGDKAGGEAGGLHDWRALRKGVVNGEGDVAYYDESFVEDPWRELLVAAGRGRAEGDGHG